MSRPVTPVEVMQQITDELAEKDIWTGTPMESFRRLGPTNRGEAGERFMQRFLVPLGVRVENGTRTDETDWKIEGKRSEVKTASLGTNDTFQFNHVRLDHDYAILVATGVCPSDIVCDAWLKSEVAAGKAGKLARMARGQSVTYKITRPLGKMRPIHHLPAIIRALAGSA